MVLPSEGGAEIPVRRRDQTCAFGVLKVGAEDLVSVGAVAESDDDKVIALGLCAV